MTDIGLKQCKFTMSKNRLICFINMVLETVKIHGSHC